VIAPAADAIVAERLHADAASGAARHLPALRDGSSSRRVSNANVHELVRER
jgi:hypothetical protein